MIASYPGNNGCFKIFFGCQTFEFVPILSCQDDSHAFLGFGNRQFCPIQTFVFFWHGIQTDIKAVSQFPHGNRDTTGAKIVAFFNKRTGLRIAEQPLNLSFIRRIALLDFGTAADQRFQRMFFGRTRRSAAAIPACPAANQYNHVTLFRRFANDIFSGGSTDDRTDLHSFSDKAFVIDFGNLTCRQSDLIAVRTISGCSNGGNLSLRQFTG